MIDCFNQGLFWRGIMHDMSKFRPSEFIPYARYFNGSYPSEEECDRMRRFCVSHGRTKLQVDRDFNTAWLKHIHRNKHHWQYWILREDSGKIIALEMPHKYVGEMISDWNGAGKAISGKENTLEWYSENRSKIILHIETRHMVETCINYIE